MKGTCGKSASVLLLYCRKPSKMVWYTRRDEVLKIMNEEIMSEDMMNEDMMNEA